MDTFYQNNIINNINVDSAVSQILSYFDPFYILNVMDDSFKMRFRPYNSAMPNLVLSYEERFKMIKDQFPNMSEQCIAKREEIYELVIDKICNFYNLSVKKEMVTNYNQYSLAYILYQILVADFTNSLFNFFISYIREQKDFIYEYLLPLIDNNSSDKTSVKNTTLELNMRTYKDPKIATIQTYLPQVLDLIIGSDIDLDTLIKFIIPNNTYSSLISSCVADNGDLFKNFFAIFLVDPDTRPIMITSIKIKLHDLYMDKSKIENIMLKEKK